MGYGIRTRILYIFFKIILYVVKYTNLYIYIYLYYYIIYNIYILVHKIYTCYRYVIEIINENNNNSDLNNNIDTLLYRIYNSVLNTNICASILIRTIIVVIP